MNPPSSPPISRPSSTKLRAYEAVYWLNRSLEAALLCFERLERLGMFSLDHLNEYKIRMEQTRAEANEELSDRLHEVEMEDAARFERMARVYEDGRKDPDDVFLAAARRKREIRDEIRELRKSLKRKAKA
jgi:hypothetical protein